MEGPARTAASGQTSPQAIWAASQQHQGDLQGAAAAGPPVEPLPGHALPEQTGSAGDFFNWDALQDALPEPALPVHAPEASPPETDVAMSPERQTLEDFLGSSEEESLGDVTLDDLFLMNSPGRSPGAASSSGAATVPT